MKSIGAYDGANNNKIHQKIFVTQPRRVAATSLAMRVAKERNSPAPGMKGSEVGYHIRLRNAVSEETKIVYCTVGILLQMLINSDEGGDVAEGFDDGMERNEGSPPMPLSHISHVIIDEVHERDLNTGKSPCMGLYL